MLLLLIACSSEPAPTTQQIPADPAADSAAAAEMLCNLVMQAKAPCAQEGDTLSVGQDDSAHSVKVTMTADPSTWVPGRTIGMGRSATELPGSMSVDFLIQVQVDGAPLPAFHAKGRGTSSGKESAPSRVAAREKGLQLWGITTGAALVDSLLGGSGALQSLGEGGAELSVDGYRVTRGVAVQKAQAGLAGQEQAGRMALDHGRMIQALAPLLPKDDKVHGVRLDVAFDPNGQGCPVGDSVLVGSVEVDGAPSGRLCEVVDGYPWPQVDGVHGIEVFYAYTPESAPAAQQ